MLLTLSSTFRIVSSVHAEQSCTTVTTVQCACCHPFVSAFTTQSLCTPWLLQLMHCSNYMEARVCRALQFTRGVCPPTTKALSPSSPFFSPFPISFPLSPTLPPLLVLPSIPSCREAAPLKPASVLGAL